MSPDGDLLPAPADMMVAMSQGDWARMGGFTLFSVICCLADMQRMAILFSNGHEAVSGVKLSAVTPRTGRSAASGRPPPQPVSPAAVTRVTTREALGKTSLHAARGG